MVLFNCFNYLQGPDDCPVFISFVIIFPCSWLPCPTACQCIFLKVPWAFQTQQTNSHWTHYIPFHLRPFALLQFFKWLSLVWSQIQRHLLREALPDQPIYRGLPTPLLIPAECPYPSILLWFFHSPDHYIWYNFPSFICLLAECMSPPLEQSSMRPAPCFVHGYILEPRAIFGT